MISSNSINQMALIFSVMIMNSVMALITTEQEPCDKKKSVQLYVQDVCRFSLVFCSANRKKDNENAKQRKRTCLQTLSWTQQTGFVLFRLSGL